MSLNIKIELPVETVRAIQNAVRLEGDPLQTVRNMASQAVVDAVKQLPYAITPMVGSTQTTAAPPNLKRSSSFASLSPQPNKAMKSDPATIHLFVVRTNGKVLTINVPATATIDKVQTEIEKLEGIPSAEQRLIFQGKQLLEGRSLEDYCVRPGSTLHVVLRLKGS